MRAHDRLLVVDIETILDRTLAPSDHPAETFAKPPWHQVVAISFVEARIERSCGSESFIIEDCRSGGDASYDEAKLLAGFWRHFARMRPRLVTWNGRSHDMGVLNLRAMRHGLDVSSWTGRTGGEGYRFRYAADHHCDLADQLSDFGACTRLSLQEAAETFGLPGKIFTGPGNVETLYRAGKLDQIRAYCEGDVLNLFGCYLRWARSTGLSSETDCQRGLSEFRRYLEGQESTRPHLATFLERWPRVANVEMVAPPAGAGHALADRARMRRVPPAPRPNRTVPFAHPDDEVVGRPDRAGPMHV